MRNGNRSGFTRKRFLWLSALAFSLLLTGCARRPEGGAKTRLGMEALESSDLAGAMALFQEAAAAMEDPVMLNRGMGIALLGQARYQEAAAAFQAALDAADDKMPETVRDIRFYQVTAWYRMGEYEEVVNACRQLLSEKEAPELYFLLGASSLAGGDRDSARENFDKAASLSNGDYSMYLRIYECYEEHNLTGIGDEYLQTALGFVAKTNEDQYEAGRIYFYLEQYEQARDTLMTSAQDGYLPSMRLLGEVYLRLEDYAHARAMYQSVMDQDAQNPSAYNGLALCALAEGNCDEAIDWIEQGLALEEEDGKQQLRFNEIVAYERKLDFASALVKAEAYCELYPGDENGRKELTFLRTR